MRFYMTIFLNLSLILLKHLRLSLQLSCFILASTVLILEVLSWLNYVYWPEWCKHLTRSECIPIEIFEPCMLFELFNSTWVPKPLPGVHLEQLVDEKDGLFAPIRWQILLCHLKVLLNLHLFQHFLVVLTWKWCLCISCDLQGRDPHSPKICRSVILFLP